MKCSDKLVKRLKEVNSRRLALLGEGQLIDIGMLRPIDATVHLKTSRTQMNGIIGLTVDEKEIIC